MRNQSIFLRRAVGINGQAVIAIVASLLLWLSKQEYWWIAGPAAFLSSRLPSYRKEILALSGVIWIANAYAFKTSFYQKSLIGISPANAMAISAPVLTAALFILFILFFGLTFLQTKNRTVAERPVLFHVSVFTILALLSSNLKFSAIVSVSIWLVLFIWSQFLWYINYSLVAPKGNGIKNIALNFGFFLQFMTPTTVPRGKNWQYLEKFDVSEDRSLAVSQLKGLKLIGWAIILAQFKGLLTLLFFSKINGVFAFPTMAESFDAAAKNSAFEWYYNWASLLTNFPLELLDLAITGHFSVACIRLLGFAIPRNTWRPLESITLVDFWNRYYFYFKELLADFFFYPSFARYFKNNLEVRVFFATFVSACFGNFLFHFFYFFGNIIELGFFGALFYLRSYFVYAFILSIGIGISQVRLIRGRALPKHWLDLFFARVCVILFFAITAVFNDKRCSGDWADNFRFLFALLPFKL